MRFNLLAILGGCLFALSQAKEAPLIAKLRELQQQVETKYPEAKEFMGYMENCVKEGDDGTTHYYSVLLIL